MTESRFRRYVMGTEIASNTTGTSTFAPIKTESERKKYFRKYIISTNIIDNILIIRKEHNFNFNPQANLLHSSTREKDRIYVIRTNNTVLVTRTKG